MRKLALLLALFVGGQVATAADVSGLKAVKTQDGQVHGLGLLRSTKPVHGVLFWAPKARYAAPETYDLRTLGLVSPIQNQKSCGSCWAFSITKSLESARLKAGKPLLDLAEQELVSCDSNAYGCNGGMMDDMAYVVNHGLPLEADYPYTSGGGSTGRCKSGKTVAEKGVRWGYVGSESTQPSMDQIKQALQDYGVLSTVVAAGGSDWDQGGDMTDCSNSGQNHMVNIVGWTQKDGGEKLIGANSWGPDWGEKGFFYSKQGCNEYASGSQAVSFVVVEGGPAPVPPKVELPSEIDVYPGTPDIMIGVKSQQGVSYSWTANGAALSDTDSMIDYPAPDADTVYQITAKTAAGTAQSSVKVHVLPKPSLD